MLKYPKKDNSHFFNQLKILVSKMIVYDWYITKHRYNPIWNLGEILIGTVREGFPFNEQYKKKYEDKTRTYLKTGEGIPYMEYPPDQLLPWLDEAEPEKRYCFEKPRGIRKTYLESVKRKMRDSILGGCFVRDIDKIDAFMMLNNKKTNHLDGKGRTKTNYEARGQSLNIEYPKDDCLHYLQKVVCTDPCTSRLAGMLDITGHNLQFIAHHNLDLITYAKYDYYKIGLDVDKLRHDMSLATDYDEKSRRYLLIDFRKSGLTTNRDVIKSVYDVAIEKYPIRPFISYRRCLDNIYVNDRLSLRGTSLGMDDNAISFFLSCALEAFLERNPKLQMLFVDAKFKGDDQIITLEGDEDDIEFFFAKWLKFLDKLGFLINAKKSINARVGQFCEIVGYSNRTPGIKPVKNLSFALTFLDALGCYNIVDAKQFIGSLKLSADSASYYDKILIEHAMISTVLQCPIEFTENEIYQPFELGGYYYDFDTLNEFIVNYHEGKYKYDRRLFNLVGSDRPIQPYERRRKKMYLFSMIDIRTDINDRLNEMTCEPMSERWKKAFDDCATNRQKLFNGPRLSKSGRIQKLIDEKYLYAIPLDWLQGQDKGVFKSLRVKYKRRYKFLEGGKRPKKLVESAKKKAHFIDEIRAMAILKSYESGVDEFNIQYFRDIPPCVLLWSLAKYVCKSKYAVPIYWFEMSYMNHISIERLWTYYFHKYRVGIYTYHPYELKETYISRLFRGPEDADMLIMEPDTGYLIKYNSDELNVWLYDMKRDYIPFFNGIRDKYYGMLGKKKLDIWFGGEEWLETKKVELPLVNHWDHIVDEEIYYWYEANYYAELEYAQKRQLEEPIIQRSEVRFEYYEDIVVEEEVSSNSVSEAHNSDSEEDLYERYLRKNPLDTDDEEAPVGDTSSDDSIEE